MSKGCGAAALAFADFGTFVSAWTSHIKLFREARNALQLADAAPIVAGDDSRGDCCARRAD